MTGQQTIEIQIEDGPAFGRTLRFVKEDSRSRYAPETRTWRISPLHRILSEGVDRRMYRFAIVER